MNSWKSTRVVGVGAAVEDVHHRHRQHVRRLAAEVAPQRLALLGRRGVRGGQRDAEDRVGAQARLVRRAVELDQRAVEALPGRRRRARARRSAISPLTLATALRDALAAQAVAAVAQLGGLELAGRGARGHRRAAGGAGAQRELDLDGRVAAAVEDLAGVDASRSGSCRRDPRPSASPVAPARRTPAARSGRARPTSRRPRGERLGGLDAPAEALGRRRAARARGRPCSLRATLTAAKSRSPTSWNGRRARRGRGLAASVELAPSSASSGTRSKSKPVEAARRWTLRA